MSFSKADRIAMLREMGLDVDNLYAMEVEDGQPVMKKVNIDDNNNDDLQDSAADDEVSQAIEDGTPVYNSDFYRQWVYAKMNRNLDDAENATDRFGNRLYKDFNDFMEHHYRWTYQLTMMEDEVNTLHHMQKDGDERFKTRWMFFQPWMIAEIYTDLYTQVFVVFEKSRKSSYRKCNGSPYVKVGTELVFADKIPERLMPMCKAVQKMNPMTHDTRTLEAYEKFDYKALLREMKKFRKALPKGYDWANISDWYNGFEGHTHRKLSRKWIDRFKAAGAYYTLQNAILFHEAEYNGLKGDKAYALMNEHARDYAIVKNPSYSRNDYNGWQLFGKMRECIRQNGITVANMY